MSYKRIGPRKWRGPRGTVYLLHFDAPYQHARHYIGFAVDLEARLKEHEKGQGSRLLAVVAAAGIGWVLARTWQNVDRYVERQLKNRGGAGRICPHCGAKVEDS